MQFKGNKNPFTPNILKVGKLNSSVAFELSHGKSFMRDGEDLFGVSVVSVNKKKWKTRNLSDLASAFESKNEAEAHINKLKRILKQKRGVGY
jgi:hypothetical protein